MSLTGTVGDISDATCQAYFAFVGAPRFASRDLELLRAARNHANGQRVLDGVVKIWLPPKAPSRQRWLTRSEVARLLCTAWRSKRSANCRSGNADEWHTRRHLTRFILLATYTGSRKQDVLKACFEQRPDAGFIDLERGTWTRKLDGNVATKKRQPAIPLPPQLIGHMGRRRKAGQTFAVEFNGRRVQNISKAFRELVADSGLGADVVPHVLRHTGVTWGMQNGMDIWDESG